jgi:hypothetical protein
MHIVAPQKGVCRYMHGGTKRMESPMWHQHTPYSKLLAVVRSAGCRNEERYMTFSHDAMLINVVKEAVDAAAGKPLALPAPPSAAVAVAAAADAAAGKPAALRCGLKQAFKQRLDATVAELDEAEAAAAQREWWQKGSTAAASTAAAPAAGAVRMVGPMGSSGCSCSSIPAVDFCTTPLDSSFWWAWYPDETWADAAAVADEEAAEALRTQPGPVGEQQQQPEPVTPSKQQQKAGEGHHLAPASVQHHPQGQRERVFTMRGAAGGSKQQQDGDADTEDDGGIIPGVPAAGAAAAAAAAGPPPRVVAAAARSLAVATFAPAAARPQQQQQGKQAAPSKKPSSAQQAAAAVGSEVAHRPSVADRLEAAVKAITTYTLCMAEARRQKLLVRPPSTQLARLALGELALRLELEHQRQAAVLLQAGIARTELMIGNSAATDPGSGVHTNTQGVECAVCGCDLSLAAVVSSGEPGRAVCPTHAGELDGPRTSCWLLLRYPPGYLDSLIATGLKVIPGAAAAVLAARNRQSWVAAGRFFGGTVLRKSVEAPAAAAAGGVVAVIKKEQTQEAAAAAALVAAVVDSKQDPAAAAQEGQQQQYKAQVPVIPVKLLGRLYDPDMLSKKLFEDLDGSGADSSSQSVGWDDADDYDDDAFGGVDDYAEQQQAPQQQQQQQGVAGTKQQQQQQQPEGESGGDASSGSVWQEDGEQGAGGYALGEDSLESDDEFNPSAIRSRKRPQTVQPTVARKRKAVVPVVPVKVEEGSVDAAAAAPAAAPAPVVV